MKFYERLEMEKIFQEKKVNLSYVPTKTELQNSRLISCICYFLITNPVIDINISTIYNFTTGLECDLIDLYGICNLIDDYLGE